MNKQFTFLLLWLVPCLTSAQAPTGLNATGYRTTVRLQWDDYTAFDELGYNIYRRTAGGSYGAPVRRVGVYTDYTDYGLAPGTAYFYKVSAFDAAGNESPLSAEIPATTNNNNYLKVANLDLLIPIYTGDMEPGEPNQIRHDLNIAREFFFRNTKGQLNLNLHFMEIPGNPPPNNEGVADFGTIGTDLQNRGVLDNQYDAIHVEAYHLYGWYGGAMWLGQTAGSMAHQPTWTYNPNNYYTTGDAWVFTHEFGHSLDGIIAGGSGFPDMIFNHFPWAFPLPAGIPSFDAGPDFDGMAMVLRLFDHYLEFAAPYDGYLEVADADTDGLADNDSRLPFDEADFGSSSFTDDSDLDGMTDLQEFYAGIYVGSNPNVKDTDGDGVQDDTDIYPLSNFRPTLSKTTAAVAINGTMAAGEGWQPLVSNPYYSLSPGATMSASATWDDTYLYFAFQSNTPLKYYLNMDGSGEDGIYAAPIRFPGGVYTDMNDKAYGDSYYENAVLIIRSDASQVVLKNQPVPGSQVSTVHTGGVYTTEVRIPHNLGPGFGYTYTPPSAPVVTTQSYTNSDILGINLIGLPIAEADGNVVDEWRVKNFISLTEPFHFYDVTLMGGGGGTPPSGYCTSTSNFPWEDWIAKVKVANVENASGKSPYSNFTNLTANVNTGYTPIELTTGFSYFTWDEYWRVWIDLNHDYDFDDAGEMVFEGVKTKPANGTATATLTGSLNIPASALAGPTRMRVTMKRNAYASPCEILPFGEIEDYTVNVSTGPAQLAELGIPAYEIIPGGSNSLCFTNPGQAFLHFGGVGLNYGTGAAGTFTIKGWFSKDQQLSANDMLWQSFSYAGAAPNEAVYWTFTDAVPASLAPGMYYVILQIDANNDVTESDETNNLLALQVRIGAPDFTVDNVSGVPASTNAGGSFTVAVQAKNIVGFPLGEIPGGSLIANIYLSADNQFNQAGDVQMGNGQIAFTQFSNPPLYLNGTASLNIPAAIPPSTTAGNYYLFVVLTGGCEQNTANNVSNAVPIQITSGGPVAYCQSNSNFPWEDWIAKVELGNLSKASGKSTYSNFTSLSANLTAGQDYTVKLTTGFSYFTWDEYWRVWIDWNKDGVFSTPDEVVQQKILTAPAAGTATAFVTGNVHIPDWATGTTRMRISMKRGAFPSACEILPFGEVEDYTVSIGGGGGGCIISAVTSNVQCQDNGTPQYPLDDGFTFQVMVTGTNTGSQWQMTWSGGSVTGSYGVAKTVGPLSIATFQNGFNFTVADVGTPSCTTSGSVTPPPPCSVPPQVCGFSKTYPEGNNFNGIFAEQMANGFKVIGAKPLVPTGTTFLILNTNQDGVSTGSTTENISAPMSFSPFRLKDGNYLFLSVTGDQKVKLEKRSATGTVIWSTTYALANAEATAPANVIEGNNGELFVVGSVDDNPSGTSFKLFTLKTNSAGSQQWLTTHQVLSTQGSFGARAFEPAQDGGLYVYVNPQNVDNHIVRIAANGSLSWNTMVSTTPLNPIQDGAETTDGSLIVGYITDSPSGPSPANVNFAKLTTSGSIAWVRSQTNILGSVSNPLYIDYRFPFTAAGPNDGFTVAFTGPGGLYLAGLNANGSIAWTKTHAFSPSIGFMAKASDGGYLLAGSLNNQLWLMKTDNVGAICDTPPPPADYCDSQSDAPWHDWIARVKLNTLDNQSAKSVYSEFTNLSTTLQKGQSYPITLTTGFSWQTYDEYWRVWIDWNQDNVFSSPDELVQQQILTAPANDTPTANITGSVNVPQGALTGTTRMRVTMKRGAYATACEHFTNGEVEDYTIVVVNSLNGNEGERSANLVFEAVARTTSVDLLGAYHQPDGVSEVVFEKSTDGENYQQVDALPGGFTEAVDAVDTAPAEGPNYYRLMLHLTNGDVVISPVRIISFVPTPDFEVFPNPAANLIHLNLKELLGKAVTIQLMDARGILVKTVVIDEVETPVVSPSLEVPSGYYFIWLEMPGRRSIGKKLVVENGF